jgi:hypothetical protein
MAGLGKRSNLSIGITSMEEVLDGVEPDQPYEDQIDGDDDIQEPGHDQNQNAGNDRDDW